MVKVSSIHFLAPLLTVSFVAQPAQAAALSPTQQVQQVVKWFTGFFTNSAQAAQNPDIPFLTMENCSISAVEVRNSAAQYVHLEQYINGVSLLRTAAYEFSPAETGINLSVFPYLDSTSALGSCDRSTPLDLGTLVSASCDLSLAYEPKKFVGTNAPVGCPTNFPVPGSTVVSTVTITANATDSLDQFLTPSGASFGDLIAFRRVASVPEPMTPSVLIGIGLAGIGLIRKQ